MCLRVCVRACVYVLFEFVGFFHDFTYSLFAVSEIIFLSKKYCEVDFLSKITLNQKAF